MMLAGPVRIILGVICAIVVASNALVAPALAADSLYLNASLSLLTGVLGFLGSWIGAQVALANFKRQRAFDKQLDWYERAVAAIHSLAEKIIVAVNAEDDERPADILATKWVEVQLAHRALDRVAQEAPLYASAGALGEIIKIQKKVQEIANKTMAFDPPNFPKQSDRFKLIKRIYSLGEYLEKASSPLLHEGRIHLGIGRPSLRERTQTFLNIPMTTITDKPLTKHQRSEMERMGKVGNPPKHLS